MTAAAFTLLAALSLAGEQQTDLGPAGNAYVAQTFDQYRRRHPSGTCRALGTGKRVIVTGYGPFAGIRYNMSGAIVRAMSDERFWPAEANLATARPGPNVPLAAQLQASDYGGVAYNRQLRIDGRAYQACFLVIDVTWDLAGAILVHEMTAFKPDMVVMLGVGTPSVRFEAMAVNRAAPLPGFDNEGRALRDLNQPVSQWVLPDYGVGEKLAMTWDGRNLADAVRPITQDLLVPVEAASEPSRNNEYLCNELSFIALHAARNRPTRLAGTLLTLPSPELPNPPVIGFMHLPALTPSLETYKEGVFVWARVVARTIDAALAGR